MVARRSWGRGARKRTRSATPLAAASRASRAGSPPPLPDAPPTTSSSTSRSGRRRHSSARVSTATSGALSGWRRPTKASTWRWLIPRAALAAALSPGWKRLWSTPWGTISTLAGEAPYSSTSWRGSAGGGGGRGGGGGPAPPPPAPPGGGGGGGAAARAGVFVPAGGGGGGG